MFLEVGLCVVEEVLKESPEEDGEGEEHEDAGHEPGGEGGLSVLPEQLPYQQWQTHKQDKQVQQRHRYLETQSPIAMTPDMEVWSRNRLGRQIWFLSSGRGHGRSLDSIIFSW